MATGWTVRRSNPGGGEIFRTCPDRPWCPPSLLYNGYRLFPGGKERPGCDADPSPLPVSWSRKSRSIPLLPLWAVGPLQNLSACTRVHFTFLPFTTSRRNLGAKKECNPAGTGCYTMDSEQFYIHLHYKEQLQSTYYLSLSAWFRTS